MITTPTKQSQNIRAALFLVMIGVCAALHIWKLPPALPRLQAEFGLTLVESGFLLSVFQFAGMLLGLPISLISTRIGLRRCILIGLGILAIGSAIGASFNSGTILLLSRAFEGFGFLMVVTTIPALIRQLVAPELLSRIMGFWGSYMPTGTVIILLFGSWMLSISNWQLLWYLLSVLTIAGLIYTIRIVPADVASNSQPTAVLKLVKQTLGTGNVWMLGLVFGLYTGQWTAIIGFLPTIYEAQGISGTMAGVMTALVAGVNTIGNIIAGRLLHKGLPATALLITGLGTMIITAYAAFGSGISPTAQYISIVMFSLVGGLVPATLFTLAVVLAPSQQTIPTTLGWTQQSSSFGQFATPPLVAWVVSLAGGDWQYTWIATSLLAVAGITLSIIIGLRTRGQRVHG